jgi:hypothetical protein
MNMEGEEDVLKKVSRLEMERRTGIISKISK